MKFSKFKFSPKLLTLPALAATADLALAAGGGGWITAVNNVTTLGTGTGRAITAVCFALGLAAIGYGGKLMWDKGGERGEDIKIGRIIFTIVGGTVLVALGFFAEQTVGTLGGSTSDIGRTVAPR